jgi:HD-like signal output (HDOD) protein
MMARVIVLDLPPRVLLALRRVAHELECDVKEAAEKVIQDALVGGGWLEQIDELDEDIETKGTG